ncbi:MAG TPA: RNA polymerase sigma factor [Candidatus Paceibacterota bacterium]|nr:RNA polymerase sigma factor [Candidatus Paceibacterota bacterium]
MRNHQNLVFGLAARMLGNETEAEDISQEVFLRAYDHFDDLSTRPTALGWLRTVTRNLCLNHLSRYRHRWCFFSELERENEPISSVDEWLVSDTRETDFTAFDRKQHLEKAISRLPQDQRIALVLYHFESLNYNEIAARLGISLSKVKMDIFRGRAALRRELQRLENISSGKESASFVNGSPQARSAAPVHPLLTCDLGLLPLN